MNEMKPDVVVSLWTTETRQVRFYDNGAIDCAIYGTFKNGEKYWSSTISVGDYDDSRIRDDVMEAIDELGKKGWVIDSPMFSEDYEVENER